MLRNLGYTNYHIAVCLYDDYCRKGRNETLGQRETDGVGKPKILSA